MFPKQNDDYTHQSIFISCGHKYDKDRIYFSISLPSTIVLKHLQKQTHHESVYVVHSTKFPIIHIQLCWYLYVLWISFTLIQKHWVHTYFRSHITMYNCIWADIYIAYLCIQYSLWNFTDADNIRIWCLFPHTLVHYLSHHFTHFVTLSKVLIQVPKRWVR